jgi:hypothetical protein
MFRLFSIVVERNKVEVARSDVAATFAVSGLDVWLYPDPEDRRSHFSLGGSTSAGQGQGSASSIVTAGYTRSFGGKAAH